MPTWRGGLRPDALLRRVSFLQALLDSAVYPAVVDLSIIDIIERYSLLLLDAAFRIAW